MTKCKCNGESRQKYEGASMSEHKHVGKRACVGECMDVKECQNDVFIPPSSAKS